jgi:hypothetical protein
VFAVPAEVSCSPVGSHQESRVGVEEITPVNSVAGSGVYLLQRVELLECCPQFVALSVQRGVSHPAQLPLCQDAGREGVSELLEAAKNPRGEAEEPEQLGDSGAGDPDLLRELRSGPEEARPEAVLPLPSHADGVPN